MRTIWVCRQRGLKRRREDEKRTIATERDARVDVVSKGEAAYVPAGVIDSTVPV